MYIYMLDLVSVFWGVDGTRIMPVPRGFKLHIYLCDSLWKTTLPDLIETDLTLICMGIHRKEVYSGVTVIPARRGSSAS